MKYRWLIVPVALLFVGGGVFLWQTRQVEPVTARLPAAVPYQPVATPSLPVTSVTSVSPVVSGVTSTKGIISSTTTTAVINVTTTVSGTNKAYPASVHLAVPFLSQAPKQDWSMPYQEACEEASVIMVDAFLRGQTKAFTPTEGDKAILDFVAWQQARYSPEKIDASAAEMKEMSEAYFSGRKATVFPIKTAEDVKKWLAKGLPVIVPANGKTLANPNFRGGGPIYHMLVIKGYTTDGKWITNDPGTRKGESFLYTRENLLSSIHDWNGGDVPNGAQVGLVLEPALAETGK